jgi:PAS domain S-box-containing protein
MRRGHLDQILPGNDTRLAFTRQLMTTGSVRSYDATITKKDGTQIDVIISAGLLPDRHAVLALTDVSRRNLAEKQIHALTQLRESIIDNANVWLMVLDLKGTILVWNKAAEEISGFFSAEVIGTKKIWQWIYPDKAYRKEITEKLVRIIQTNNFFENLVTTIHSKDGKEKVISWNTRGLLDSSGVTTRYVAIGQDITRITEATAALKKSEEKYRIVANNTYDWEFWLAPDGTFLYSSPSCSRITGHTYEEFLADPNLLLKIIHPDDVGVFLDHRETVEHTRESNAVEFRIIRPDGTIYWIGHVCQPVFDANGMYLGARGNNRDITSLKEAESSLKESEATYRSFFTTSHDSVFITTLDGHWVDFNNSAVEMFGYTSREELMAVKIPELYANPDDRRIYLEKILVGGHSKEYPIDLKKKDGTIIHTLITSVARRDQHGTVIGFQGTIRDITELKRAQMELQELASVVRYSGELVGLTTLDGKIIFLNNAGAQICGISPEAAVGENIFRFIPDHQKENVRTEIMPMLMKDGIWGGDLQYINQKTGNLVDVHAMVFLITDPVTDKPSHIANVSLDITERKRAEEALILAGKKLNLLNSITRHDINNQLSAMLVYLDLAQEMSDNPTIKEFLDKLKRVADTINSQIQFTKEYQDIGVISPQWQNVHERVTEAANTLNLGTVQLIFDREDLEIFADPLLQKVFYNLIDNALRYGETLKTITISSRATDIGLILTVKDDGVGISAEDKIRLFTRGFGKHTGFGLFLSREILGITGLTIAENGTPGEGAQFEIFVLKGMFRFGSSR